MNVKHTHIQYDKNYINTLYISTYKSVYAQYISLAIPRLTAAGERGGREEGERRERGGREGRREGGREGERERVRERNGPMSIEHIIMYILHNDEPEVHNARLGKVVKAVYN